MSVRFGTLGWRALSHLTFELAEPSGDVLHREGLDLADVVDNGFAAVAHLGEVELKPGRQCCGRLHWLGSEDIAVYAAPVWAGRCQILPHLKRLAPDRVFAARS